MPDQSLDQDHAPNPQNNNVIIGSRSHQGAWSANSTVCCWEIKCNFPRPIGDQVVMSVTWSDLPLARVKRSYNEHVTSTLFLPLKKLPFTSVLKSDLISTLNWQHEGTHLSCYFGGRYRKFKPSSKINMSSAVNNIKKQKLHCAWSVPGPGKMAQCKVCTWNLQKIAFISHTQLAIFIDCAWNPYLFQICGLL